MTFQCVLVTSVMPTFKLLLQKNIGSTIRQLLVKQKQSAATSTSSLAIPVGSEAAATDLVQRNPQVLQSSISVGDLLSEGTTISKLVIEYSLV